MGHPLPLMVSSFEGPHRSALVLPGPVEPTPSRNIVPQSFKVLPPGLSRLSAEPRTQPAPFLRPPSLSRLLTAAPIRPLFPGLGGLLSDAVNALINSPLYVIMKKGARDTLINSAEKNGVHLLPPACYSPSCPLSARQQLWT